MVDSGQRAMTLSVLRCSSSGELITYSRAATPPCCSVDEGHRSCRRSIAEQELRLTRAGHLEHEPQVRRDAEAEVYQALALPRLRNRPIYLEHGKEGGELRPALDEGVQSRSEDDALPDTTSRQLRDEIFDEPSTSHNNARNGRVNSLMSGRLRHPFSGSASLRPSSSSNTCGGGSTSRCRARHKATRTAVLSGASFGFSGMAFFPPRRDVYHRTKAKGGKCRELHQLAAWFPTV